MPSFDIVSKVTWHEVDNALNQAQKEISQRYDFKDTSTSLERSEEGIVVQSASADRVNAAWTVLQEKLVKRKVSLKSFHPEEPVPTGKGGAKVTVKVQEGIDIEVAKDIVRRLKDSKIKVQASIQEQQVRIAGKNRDDLQEAIALVRGAGLNADLQFVNFRD